MAISTLTIEDLTYVRHLFENSLLPFTPVKTFNSIHFEPHIPTVNPHILDDCLEGVEGGYSLRRFNYISQSASLPAHVSEVTTGPYNSFREALEDFVRYYSDSAENLPGEDLPL